MAVRLWESNLSLFLIFYLFCLLGIQPADHKSTLDLGGGGSDECAHLNSAEVYILNVPNTSLGSTKHGTS